MRHLLRKAAVDLGQALRDLYTGAALFVAELPIALLTDSPLPALVGAGLVLAGLAFLYARDHLYLLFHIVYLGLLAFDTLLRLIVHYLYHYVRRVLHYIGIHIPSLPVPFELHVFLSAFATYPVRQTNIGVLEYLQIVAKTLVGSEVCFGLRFFIDTPLYPVLDLLAGWAAWEPSVHDGEIRCRPDAYLQRQMSYNMQYAFFLLAGVLLASCIRRPLGSLLRKAADAAADAALALGDVLLVIPMLLVVAPPRAKHLEHSN